MQYPCSLSNEEKKIFFHTELVRYGVKYDRAATVAKILAAEKPDELLTEEEKQLVDEVCNEWLNNYNRYKNIQQSANL
ncbi:hypothetical protein H6G41_31235 [Tolypothrix sp. FACHB-123]|uniref:hypothetical protein n=1 Tax=Tolypothrix sp. FACHB-123 TaxID=2692868 RepID=UPI0016832A68|nr:hypothetical protein [Tolypothrix sp. FACHB-123]MBD2359010.1 hypothetical protein [Tolypothrix sp. FACHB-123]